MIDLSVTYLGKKLANPVVVSSCGLVKDLAGVRRYAAAGAGAIVLKSLFEEQLAAENPEATEPSWLGDHAEAYDYLQNSRMELGPREYLELIAAAKREVSIPVFASLNCVSPRWWNQYAHRIQDAGADGIELNMALRPSHPGHDSAEIEHVYWKILEQVKREVSIPVAVKMGPFFTTMARHAKELSFRGASALVLFNRFSNVDIDIEQLKLKNAPILSHPVETHLPLRWISLLSGRIQCDLAASTGIHEAKQAIQHLLAGATVVMVCSTLYLHGPEQIGVICQGISHWMEKHGFSSLADFRGRLSQEKSGNPDGFERLQYIKALVGIE